MMYPRLKLLQKLLSPDGVIFISIDDNELYNLKEICDEIFGASCFVANISWQRTYSTRNDSKGIVSEVEHILVYGKSPDWQPNKLSKTADMDTSYKNPDNDFEPWTSSDTFVPDSVAHQGMVYGLQHPITGKMIYPTAGRHWAYGQDQVLEIMRGWAPYELRDIEDRTKRAERVIDGYTEEHEETIKIFDEKITTANLKKGKELYDRAKAAKEDASIGSIREYVWYTETNSEYSGEPSANPYLLGTDSDIAYYFCYEPDRAVALNGAKAMTERIVAGGFAHAFNHASTLLDKAARFMD